ncbi:hypothetical protein [Ruminococcus sp.]|uniref:hypothetical protein n=1 Tax=Ruminococcus sp. TaxID=41978 RepID=UPI001B6A56FD|nr:hypothetical protein [Ruminococcus sp.]MBP5433666.1 hypothetical protein [Ruminococcus sp.]
MEETVFTSAGVLDLLSQIDELRDYDIHLDDNNGNISLTIGETTYKIAEPEEVIEVPEEVVAEISDIADEAVGSIAGEPEPVESGLIKEALKTLLVGGAVRLAAKILEGR